MGYFLTPGPENAVPPNSWASPKPHVPGSPVKERGLRYYNPSSGRFVSQDPANEVAFMRTEGGMLYRTYGRSLRKHVVDGAEYVFVRNNPVVNYDLLGLKCCAVDRYNVPINADYDCGARGVTS